MITNVLTVDVEEYYHAAIFRRGAGGMARGGFESRVGESMRRLADLMRAHQTRATLFVLGEIAAAHPRLLRSLAADQHEIACHGDRHDDVSALSPRQFREDIRRARARIEDAVGRQVIGYRAPNFSIGPAQSWAYEILFEEGFRYDSSLHPIHHDRYGQPDAPRFPFEVWRDGPDSLTEFPIGTVRLFGVNFPIGGGGYFRLLPYDVVRRGIRRVNEREQQPVMFYVHPWELDPGQPRPPMPWHHRFRHYVGVEKEAGKLARLFQQFRFGTASAFLDARVCGVRVFDALGERVSMATV
ncbi:MAG TPA: XrtA system polysaccharide deacetylase [Vicinamibacterales bacterium]|nr:XrtA system polysaccharide deacetylase [Vicinamibacterales bacterium]